MTGFQRLCLATCAILFILIVVGGTVRATDSGLGCPDWPTCHGHVIPKTDKATLIEYSHRMTASVVGFMVLGIVVSAWRRSRRVPAVFAPAIVLGVLVLFQAGLGGVVVVQELPPEVVTVHLGTALSILSVLLLLTVTLFAIDRPMPSIDVSASFRRLLLAATAMAFLLMLIGAYLAGSDYGLACNGWPLCNGEVIPSASSASVMVHFIHRVIALLLGISLLALAWLGLKQRARAPLASRLAMGALHVYILQALVGAANIWTKLADEVSIAHLAVGTLLWMILAVLTIRTFALHEWLPRSSQPGPSSRLAKVSR